jgi:hypothetical protein
MNVLVDTSVWVAHCRHKKLFDLAARFGVLFALPLH